ncbi:MAG: GFA family protein [Paracoccaceae bacterium]
MVTYSGNCFCGGVEVEVTGEPEASLVCHCKICRAWSAGPVNGATLWKPENVTVTKGKDLLKSYAQNDGHDRTWCTECGGHVFTDHTDTYGVIDVYASILEDYDFKPAFHINYASSILPIKDGLPKFVDFPEPLGGSGDTMAE